ncbi:hypothetical protein AOL_s00006g515 [Orbilia oligospora ATCC 24927]|uniref:Fucose-specific lectin n=2 Tax=Orbilia oligospora TaxID=2813651 RepID=G1X0W4_ARTOA|nr:hypothetical protein AOL_s00006g515 [Orbilia oligospora ATCC 24927]EGX53137.1 hypothetical protein AOL_s00006g515 [Orbilia oligospora ATCC 24927]KAF3291499.1 hypothetical protein TWF970_000712 [Orbilia oligospora]
MPPATKKTDDNTETGHSDQHSDQHSHQHSDQHSDQHPKPKPKVNTMTAPFTTIINPLYQITSTGVPQLLTFWINGGSDVVLQARNNYSTADEPTFSDTATEGTGPLENPSSLTSFVYQALVRAKFLVRVRGHPLCVYGISPKKEIVRVSPTFQVVDSVNCNIEKNAPSLAGCSDGADAAWLYYFKTNTVGRQELKEYDVSGKQLTPYVGTVETDPYSKLAAVYIDAKTRCVFFQITGDKDSNIGMVDPITGSNGIITSATNVLPNSPIAACLVEDAIWVYYLDKSENIMKLIIGVANVAAGGTAFASIPAPTSVNSDTPLKYSSLSASPSPIDRNTYVTYALPAGSNPIMRCFVDPWPSK